MLNTYDNFTLNSIETSTKWWNRDYVVDIKVLVFS